MIILYGVMCHFESDSPYRHQGHQYSRGHLIDQLFSIDIIFERFFVMDWGQVQDIHNPLYVISDANINAADRHVNRRFRKLPWKQCKTCEW